MSDITPEQVADALTGGDDVNEVLNRWVDVAAIPGSSAVRITVTPINDDGDQDTENAQHFTAVVVEGETVPDLAEASRLKARLDAAEWCMRQALAALEHEEALYLLNRYFAAAEAAQAQTGGAA